MTTEFQVIGKPVARTDGPDKVTGKGKYSLDIVLPGTLWVKLLRSPYPHARVVKVDPSRALALPGVRAVLTPDDVRGLRWGKALQDEPILAWDAVRYIGDKVAAVAADDEEIAERALDLIDVEYEELPAVFTADQARQTKEAILHPDFNDYRGIPERLDSPSNVFALQTWGKGDPAQGFEDADLIVERFYTTPRSHQAYLEPHNCTVWIDDQGQVQVWLGSTAAFRSRNLLAELFDLPVEKITVNRAYVGGEFGGKADPADSPICYLLAKKTGLPVKLKFDYADELSASNPRHESTMRIKAGVKRDGTLTAWEADVYYNSGAYGAYKPVPGSNLPGTAQIAGPYRIPHVKINSFQVYTNTVPCGFARSPGEVQAIFAGESHMDIIASELGMDPIELRLHNIIHDGDDTPAGLLFEDIKAEAVLRETLRVAGWYDSKPANVGRGFAIGNRSQIGGETHVGITLHPNGDVTASSSIFDPGMGTDTMIQQIVAEELEIPVSRIRMIPYNTDDVSNDTGIGGTRGSYVAPEAAHSASEDLKGTLRRLAAELQGWDEEVISYKNGLLVNTRSTQEVAMEEIATQVGAPIVAKGHILDMEPSSYTSFIGQVAEVEMDMETGTPKLLRITAVHDSARVINPVGYYGQVEGGVVSAIGGAMMEEIVVDEGGRVTNPSLADFKLPTQHDIPDLRISLIQDGQGRGRYSVKGVGEHSNITAAPAIANAIADACGARIFDLPITAEKVWRLRQRIVR